MILMLDNYDSFTYNLVQYFEELGASVLVRRNDQITLAEIEELNPEKIVISPGPSHPENAGITLAVIKKFAGKIPLFGVCLGHQAIGQAFGGKVMRAEKPMHGKIDQVYHAKKGVFKNLPSPFRVVRYHSLIVQKEKLPDCFEITAWTQNEKGEMEEIMGIRHKTLLVEGVQFHPESVGTEYGHELLKEFYEI